LKVAHHRNAFQSPCCLSGSPKLPYAAKIWMRGWTASFVIWRQGIKANSNSCFGLLSCGVCLNGYACASGIDTTY
jgi:hypothetical protein